MREMLSRVFVRIGAEMNDIMIKKCNFVGEMG